MTRAGFGCARFAVLAANLCVLLAARSAEIQPPAAADQRNYALRWASNATGASPWFLEVTGLNPDALRKLDRADWTATQWQRLLAVHTEEGDVLSQVGLPPVLGTYRIRTNTIQFEPQFPLEPGLKYQATFYPQAWPGLCPAGARLLTQSFGLPARRPEYATTVSRIYPTADVLPENLLKFYVHFSAPMRRGHIYEHIHLQNGDGQEIELPFLEIDEELWDPTMTRLTLFIDPGRIKRGVRPLEEVGPALEEGKRYSLTIGKEWKDASGTALQESFSKTFRVGPASRKPVDPARWKIQLPKAGTRQPLTVLFSEPMDHALAQRMICVVAGERMVEGKSSLEDQERRWIFSPARAWPPGGYALAVPKTIEDLAGNNIGKSFEVDLFEGVQRRFTNATVKLPFEVR